MVVVTDTGVTLCTVRHFQTQITDSLIVAQERLILDIPHTADSPEKRIAVVLTETRACVVTQQTADEITLCEVIFKTAKYRIRS